MKKILLISLALVLALGTLGVAAALWWDDLVIDGIIETGNIGVDWSVDAWYDNEDDLKDVSWVDAYLVGPDLMYIDIWNAYPCITYTVEWDLHCWGSVPVHFLRPEIQTNLPAGAELTFTYLDGSPIIWEEVQLHENDRMVGKLTVHLDNTAEQDSDYSFWIRLVYHQYNETPVGIPV